MIINETWDILKEDGSPTGKTIFRGERPLHNGEYHLVVHIWIMTSDGRFLIQRRSEERKLMPGEWAATGGAAVSGEDSLTAARRELFEEVGIATAPHDLKFLARIKRRNSLLDIWLTVSDTPANQLSLQRSEVAEVKHVTYNELQTMIRTGQYHPYGSEYFQTVFEKIRELRGAVL